VQATIDHSLYYRSRSAPCPVLFAVTPNWLKLNGSVGVEGQKPRCPFADGKPRKTYPGILQVWETGLLHNLRGLAKELVLTGQFRPAPIFS
uniref:Uncharacterized protein n=1 Tax=Romanomermis culicivorax TaxID=13658 RepID=A0A915K6X7_ROMCU